MMMMGSSVIYVLLSFMGSANSVHAARGEVEKA
jgi:hypothetical protein